MSSQRVRESKLTGPKEEYLNDLPAFPISADDSCTINISSNSQVPPSSDDVNELSDKSRSIWPQRFSRHKNHRKNDLHSNIFQMYFERRFPLLNRVTQRHNDKFQTRKLTSNTSKLISNNLSQLPSGGTALMHTDRIVSREWFTSRDSSTTFNGTIALDIQQEICKQDFLMSAAQAYISYGSPVHRMEHHILNAALSMDVSVNFIALPAGILFTFDTPMSNMDNNETLMSSSTSSDTHIVKAMWGYHLHKLAQVHELVKQLSFGEISVQNALNRVQEIKNEKHQYHWIFRLLAYPVSSFTLTIIVFQGSWTDALVASIGGSCVGITTLAAEAFADYSRLYEVSSAVLVAFLARILQLLVWPHLCYWSATLGGVIWLLPGLSISLAVQECAAHELLSGTVRMFYSLISALMLGFGLSLGLRTAESMPWLPTDVRKEAVSHPEVICPPTNHHVLTSVLLTIPMLVSFSILLKAHPSQYLLMGTTSAITLASQRLFVYMSVSSDLVSTLSAFVLGLIINAYSRLTGNLAVVPLLPAMLLLVPGTLSVKGSFEWIGNNDANNGNEFGFACLKVALALTVGLFTSSLIISPISMKKAAKLNSIMLSSRPSIDRQDV